jgi:hypothetical protein
MVDSLARLPLSSRGGARWYSGLIPVAIPDMNISLMMLGIVFCALVGHALYRRLLSTAVNFPDKTCRSAGIDSLLG